MTRHLTGRVVDSGLVETASSLVRVSVTAPGIPELVRPGTRVVLALPGRLTGLSLWVYQAREAGPHGETVELVAAGASPAGWLLNEVVVGTEVGVTGPVGRPFALPKEPVPCLLVGQGPHAAALALLAERLAQRGCAVTLLLGGRDSGEVLAMTATRKFAKAVTVVTEDGSMGRPGRLADAVDEAIVSSDAHVVYAAGDTALLHLVAAAAETRGVWSQTAVDQRLPCGTGLCHGCVVPVVGEDGKSRMLRACVDGPVFRGDRVRWGDLAAIEGPDEEDLP